MNEQVMLVGLPGVAKTSAVKSISAILETILRYAKQKSI